MVTKIGGSDRVKTLVTQEDDVVAPGDDVVAPGPLPEEDMYFYFGDEAGELESRAEIRKSVHRTFWTSNSLRSRDENVLREVNLMILLGTLLYIESLESDSPCSASCNPKEKWSVEIMRKFGMTPEDAIDWKYVQAKFENKDIKVSPLGFELPDAQRELREDQSRALRDLLFVIKLQDFSALVV